MRGDVSAGLPAPPAALLRASLALPGRPTSQSVTPIAVLHSSLHSIIFIIIHHAASAASRERGIQLHRIFGDDRHKTKKQREKKSLRTSGSLQARSQLTKFFRATWSQEQLSGPRRHSCGAPRREYALEQLSGPRRHSCGVPRRGYARSLLARHQQQSRSPPVAASAQGRAFVRGGISLMWPPPTRQTPPSAASRPIAHPPVQQSSQGLRAAYARGGTSLMRPPLTRHTHSP